MVILARYRAHFEHVDFKKSFSNIEINVLESNVLESNVLESNVLESNVLESNVLERNVGLAYR